MNELRKELLELLSNDEAIRAAVKAIGSEEAAIIDKGEVDRLAKELSGAKKEILHFREEADQNFKEVQTLQKQLISLTDEKNQFANQVSDLMKELEIYREKELHYKRFNELSEEVRENLTPIINGNSFESILVSLSLDNRIEMFWDYLKNMIQNKARLEDEEKLVAFFYLYLDTLVKADDRFAIQRITVGDTFDTDEMIRHSDGKASGKVKKVLLKGYVKQGNIVRKSIVML